MSDKIVYMMRRKFYVPKDEVTRYYHEYKDRNPTSYGFDTVMNDEDSIDEE